VLVNTRKGPEAPYVLHITIVMVIASWHKKIKRR
jgi:hypothetical protein